MDFVCDDIKGEILQVHPSNNYRLSMVSKEWHRYCMSHLHATQLYKDFKILCRRDDMLSIAHSTIHPNVAVYYSYAFACDEIVKFCERHPHNKQYTIMGSCRGGQEIRVCRQIALGLLSNRHLLYYATKGRNMLVIDIIMDLPLTDLNQGNDAAYYMGDDEMIARYANICPKTDNLLHMAIRGNQEKLIERIISTGNVRQSDIQDAIFRMHDNTTMLTRLSKYINSHRIIECIDLIKSGSPIIPDDIAFSIRSYTQLFHIACRYENYAWINVFIDTIKCTLTSRYLSIKLTKYLLSKKSIDFSESCMLKIYKLNDPELTTMVKEQLTKKYVTLYI